MATDAIILVGTAKGLFRFRSQDRHSWQQEGPDFPEAPVYSAIQDPRSGMLWAGVNSIFYGPLIHRSHDLGASWEPSGEGLAYSKDDPEEVTRVWSLLPGPITEPSVLYAGVEASGLFRTEDGGASWHEMPGARSHATHDLWGPGFGGKCMHTVAQDPLLAERMYFACSTGGFYRSDDRAATWSAKNQGIRADFLPEGQQHPVAGQCVHKFTLSAKPGRMYLQNHGGVYRSDDSGDSWIDIGHGLPSDFGFPIVAHINRPDTAYIIPLGGDSGGRWPPEAVLSVYRTDDAGGSWQPLRRGLPVNAFTGVLRDAFRADSVDPDSLYFGTTSGSLFASTDQGESWQEVSSHLPRIHCVSTATSQA